MFCFRFKTSTFDNRQNPYQGTTRYIRNPTADEVNSYFLVPDYARSRQEVNPLPNGDSEWKQAGSLRKRGEGMYKSKLHDVLHVNECWASVSIHSQSYFPQQYAPCTGACPETHQIIESFIAYLNSIFFYKLVSHQNGKMEIFPIQCCMQEAPSPCMVKLISSINIL